MLGDSFRKVRSGERLRIPAAAWNAMLEATAAVRGNGQFDPQRNRSRPDGTVLVRNDSGGALDRFAVLGVDDIVITADDNLPAFQTRPVLSGVTPSAADHAGLFVVLQEPVVDGKVARAMVLGVTAVQINVSNAAHSFADVADGESGYLASGMSGAAQILYKPAGTGTLWALVRLIGGVGTAANPADLVPADLEDDTPSATTWDRDSPPAGKDGVQFLPFRVYYDETAETPELVGVYRVPIFDSHGKLKSIAADAEYVIDQPRRYDE